MSKKIFRSIIAVAMIVLITSLVISSTFLYDFFNKSQITQLKDELSLAADNVNKLGAEYFDGFKSSVFRYTLVASDGSVIYDSQAEPDKMENHLKRKEIAEAVKTGKGSSARYSSTLTERTFYEAVRLENGNILRISASQITIGALLLGLSPAIAAVIIASVIIAIVLSEKMAKSIVKPLNELDLDNPSDNNTYEELAPILEKLNKQHGHITSQMQELKKRSDEFRQITASMSEGLVLLDENGKVLSINNAAEDLFNTSENAVGLDFLVLDRNVAMSKAIEKALKEKHSELCERHNDREYKFIINRTESDGKVIGIVIICIDVTDEMFAEQKRKEFTANVSHELKTPLQSIIGSAELLENGLVKPEDTQKFVGNIKKEAARLVTLINDIIRLSQLDEESEPATETVDVFEVAKEVGDVLADSAAKKFTDLQIDGEPCIMNGNRRYIYEIIYNLCDNAIRYNREGGNVWVSVKNNDGHIELSVRDNGIGIPKEHQSRIFERFYRVDKSHSKETGGTGLGLSIVKHAVEFHGGTIRLESTVGEGTTVTVIF